MRASVHGNWSTIPEAQFRPHPSNSNVDELYISLVSLAGPFSEVHEVQSVLPRGTSSASPQFASRAPIELLENFSGGHMKRLSAIAVCSLMLLLGVTQAAATIIVYNVTLSGTESVPANASTAFGTATVTVDDILDSVAVALSFSGLLGGNASAAHIHCCVPTTATGPVVIPFTGFPTTTSGTYSNTFLGVSAANIAGIEAGLAYINIHDAVFPGGEIRGNILATSVPEPASLSLVGIAALALFALRRARAKRSLPSNSIS
jgi:CHRD domain/PEP-CTERM motif